MSKRLFSVTETSAAQEKIKRVARTEREKEFTYVCVDPRIQLCLPSEFVESENKHQGETANLPKYSSLDTCKEECNVLGSLGTIRPLINLIDQYLDVDTKSQLFP